MLTIMSMNKNNNNNCELLKKIKPTKMKPSFFLMRDETHDTIMQACKLK